MNQKLILFIHGLGGRGEETWQNNSSGFLDLIKNDENLSDQYDVACYEYPTTLFRIPFLSPAPKIQTLSDGLKTQIDNLYSSYSSIVLVCHSLGGLIARQYLVEEIKNNKVLKIEKLLMFAVPNNGAQLASLAKFITWRHNQLSQLCKKSDFITILNEEWARLNVEHQIDIKYVVAGIDSVVQESSAKSFWGNQRVETVVDKGHINLVKPTSNDDLSFVLLKNFIDQKRADVITFDLSHGQENWDNYKEFIDGLSEEKLEIKSDLLNERSQIDRSSVIFLAPPFKSQILDREAEYIKRWVYEGGGLFLMGYYAADTHHGGNPSRIAREFGYSFGDDLVAPNEINENKIRVHVNVLDDKYAVKLEVGDFDHAITKDVNKIGFISSCTINTDFGSRELVLTLNSPSNSRIWDPEGPIGPKEYKRRTIHTWNVRETASVPLLIAFEYGKGRVVLSSSWKITTLKYGDNPQLVKNIVEWLSNTD